MVPPSPYEWSWYECRLVRFAAAETGAVTELANPLRPPSATHPEQQQQSRQVAQPQWSPDGRKLAFICSTWSDRGCVTGDLLCVDISSKTVTNLTSGIPASLGWASWEVSAAGEESLLCIGHEQGGSGLHRVAADGSGSQRLWWEACAVAEGNWPRFSLMTAPGGSQGGRPLLACIKESSSKPRDVWLSVWGAEGRTLSWRQVTSLHEQELSRFTPLPPATTVRWAGSDGLPMQGLHFEPVTGAAAAGATPPPPPPPPTVMYVHGGPIGVQGDRFYPASPGGPCSIALLQQHGYAVFAPNYRGSVGWGLDFAEANWEDCGGMDYEDMMRGLDNLVAAGRADEGRLAVMGWSYGGFTTAWAVSQSQRFRAAVMGAGYGDWQ